MPRPDAGGLTTEPYSDARVFDDPVSRMRVVLDHKTRYDHDQTMKRALVSELKTHLSSYLAEVRRGQTIIVCDRATPIARLIPYEADEADGFEVVPASLHVSELKRVRSVRPKRSIDVVRLLREDRDAR